MRGVNTQGENVGHFGAERLSKRTWGGVAKGGHHASVAVLHVKPRNVALLVGRKGCVSVHKSVRAARGVPETVVRGGKTHIYGG